MWELDYGDPMADEDPDAPFSGPEVHTYEPDETGRCTSGWYNRRGEWIECRSTQRSSVLHDDPDAAFRQAHWHGGGDCMCFEGDE